MRRGAWTRSTLLLAAAVLATSCEGEGTEPPDPTVVEVHLTAQNTFDPAVLTIERGTIVRFVNDIQRFHTVAPQDRAQPGVWQEASLNDAGQKFEHTFTSAGAFSYFCRPHVGRGMTGTITVN